MFHVTRRFEFDAAHRLFGYEGKCKHLHGHRYAAEVTVAGEVLDELGMLLDFGELKVVKEWIDICWDHNMLLQGNDPLWAGMPAANMGKMPYSTIRNPTAEIMAFGLFQQVASLISGYRCGKEASGLESDVRVTRVRIYETPDCWVDYEE